MSVVDSINGSMVPDPRQGKGDCGENKGAGEGKDRAAELNNAVAFLPVTPRAIAAGKNFQTINFIAYWFFYSVVCSLAITFVFERCVISSISRAINKLPQSGEIVSGKLNNWETNSNTALVEGKFVSIYVNSSDQEDSSDNADLQIVFARDELRFRSLLGWLTVKYPEQLDLPLNYKQLWPLWGAYQTAIIAAVFLSSVVFLILIWTFLAFAYSLLYIAFARVLKRMTGGKSGAFKIAGASLIPGALIMTFGLLTYSFGYIDLITLLIVFCSHILIAWIYLFLSLFSLPKIPEDKENPFVNAPRHSQTGKSSNPFIG
ncbi:MAG: hypothetical protein ACP5T0_03540 [Verrucomicrobiia bacterium]